VTGTVAARARAYGARAEERAAAFLALQGLTVVERNWRRREGEVDIIAREGDTLCFVEVKARRSRRFGHPAQAVDGRKQARMARVAGLYLQDLDAQGQPPVAVRFDVVCVDDPRGACTLLRDAFRPEEG
jgi:putative endonuclease